MIACEKSGHIITDDFPEVRKIVSAGVTSKPVKDYELTRYAMWIDGDVPDGKEKGGLRTNHPIGSRDTGYGAHHQTAGFR